MQLVIAVSDGGRIHRLDDWKEPQNPFRVFVTKADLVTDKIDRELARHRTGASLFHVRPVGKYGIWGMVPEEVPRVADFLAARHVESRLRSATPVAETDASRNARYLEIRERHPNAYDRWTPEDLRELERLHEGGLGVAELAVRFGRQPTAIESRLRKLGRV